MPTGHVLGLGSASSIAPDIIMSGWKGIVDTIRQTGDDVAKNVVKIQTGKQLKAFGQEMSQVNPSSPDFIPAMLNIAGKYPLVQQSEAGQNSMGLLGLAHKQALDLQKDDKNFNQQIALEGLRSQFRMNEDQNKTPKMYNTPGGLYDPGIGGIIEGTAPTKSPWRNVGGYMFNSDTQEFVAPPDMTPGQQARFDETKRSHLAQENYRNRSLGMQGGKAGDAQAKMAISQIKGKVDSLDRDAASLRSSLKSLDPSSREFAEANQRLKDIIVAQDEARKRLDDLELPAMDYVPSAPVGAPGLGGGIPLGAPPPLFPDTPVAPQGSRSSSYLKSKLGLP